MLNLSLAFPSVIDTINLALVTVSIFRIDTHIQRKEVKK